MRVKINGFVIIKAFNEYKVYRRKTFVGTVHTYSEAFTLAGGM